MQATKAADIRADVYSLGCVLYECVIGQPPFPRDTDVAVVFAHLNSEPTPASATRPELPSALDAVIATALAKEREERYQSPRDLAQAALSVTVDEATGVLRPVAHTGPGRRPGRLPVQGPGQFRTRGRRLLLRP